MTTLEDGAGTSSPQEAPTSSIWHRLYHGETTWDFVGRRRIGFGISAVFLLLALLSLIGRGLNFGIDFEGGVSWEVAAENIDSDEIHSVLAEHGVNEDDIKIQYLEGSDGKTVRIQVPVQTPEVQNQVKADLAEAAGVQPDDVSSNSVSSTWGHEITKKAATALVVFMALLIVYISWRFEWKMAVAAILAMIHDVAISVGVYSIFQFTVSPATVIAFLTILGYSLYDTIVVFDMVHENEKRFGTSRVAYGDIVNLSMNQVLMRSINTSIATVLPVASLLVVGAWIMGATALTDFSLALFIGILAGAYSSIFIATPLLAMLKRKEKRYAALGSHHAHGAELAMMRGSGGATMAGSRAATAPAGSATAGGGRTASSDPTMVLQHPPRPRKKRRR